METVLDIPDALFQRCVARASSQGQSAHEFMVDVLREKLGGDSDADSIPTTEPDDGADRLPGSWRDVFGTVSPEEAAEIQRIIDAEFNRVDPEEWK